MKAHLPFLFLLFPLMGISQIQFEPVAQPDDYNVRFVCQSPVGEYFTQPLNNSTIIYRSLDGEVWEQAQLPQASVWGNLQFFSDGTPVMKPKNGAHLIRRDDTWYDMSLGGNDYVDASFIKDDTLFVFQNTLFAYSLDEGETFTTLFQDVTIGNHTAQLWKFDAYFILYTTVASVDRLYVYDAVGNQLLFETLDLSGTPSFAYNNCGELLILDDYQDYYLFKSDGLVLEEGVPSDILPGVSTALLVQSHFGSLYHRFGETLFKSTGCGFNWTTYADDLREETEYCVTAQGDILMSSLYQNYFFQKSNGGSDWVQKPFNIAYPYFSNVDESYENNQFVSTRNEFFGKQTLDLNWLRADALLDTQYDPQVSFSDNGDLYIDGVSSFLYSQDDGVTFTEIPYANTNLDFDLFVFDGEVLLLNHAQGTFYSVDNGQTWNDANIQGFSDFFRVEAKLVGDQIYIFGLDNTFSLRADRVNITSNEVQSESLGITNVSGYKAMAIQRDGTIYFFLEEDAPSGEPAGLYQFRFGEDVTSLGVFQNLFYKPMLSTTADDLLVFDKDQYSIFNGTDFDVYPLLGLPAAGLRRYDLSRSQHLYVTIDNRSLYRSTAPLATTNFIKGRVVDNENLDCIANDDDPGLGFWQVKLEKDNYYRIRTTDHEGQFSFAAPQGNYSIRTTPLNSNWELCAPAYDITLDGNDTIIVQDFQTKALANCASLELDFSTPLLRRCFDNYYSVRVRNTGPSASNGTTLQITLDPFFDLSSATIAYTEIAPQVIEFDLGILEVGDQINFNIHFNLDCDAELGAEHCLEGSLEDTNICGGTPVAYTECQQNIGSFDPNDKRTFNDAGYEVDGVDKDAYIVYHIRFQNTGTDTAFMVRVVDPLDPNLNVETLEMLSASHPYTYTISDGPFLEVLFEDILLPDSTTNEPASNGFFKFRIKPIEGLDYGTSIPNEAAIYFDFNEPIITNEAVFELQNPLNTRQPERQIAIELSPNPARDLIYLSVVEQDIIHMDAFEVLNAYGQIIQRHKLISSHQQLDVSALPAGVYYISWKQRERSVGTAHFIKF